MVDLSQYAGVGGIAVLAGLVGVIIAAFYPKSLSVEYKPHVSALLAILLAVLIGYTTGSLKTGGDWLSWGLGGLLAGLSAVGGYEATWDKLKKPQSLNQR